MWFCIAVLIHLTVLFVWDLLLACWHSVGVYLFCGWLMVGLIGGCGVIVLMFVVVCSW